jgi:putative phage-type endonuclease
MQRLELIQNTKEWEELRSTKLGASDANIIMGVSEYCTIRELWMRKKGLTAEKKSNDFAKNKGHRIEEKYRNTYELETDLEWPPLVALSEDIPFLMASLDGYNPEIEANWECKYVGQEDFENVKSGKMLDKYYPQVQMQLFLTNAKSCHFLCATDDKESDFKFKKTVLIVKPDFEYQKALIKKMVIFWESLKEGKMPDANESDIIDLSDNKELVTLINTYKKESELLKEQEAHVEQLKKDIFKIAKNPKNECNGVKITTSVSEPESKPDYEKYVTTNSIVIPEEFWAKGKPKTTQRITFPKSKE